MMMLFLMLAGASLWGQAAATLGQTELATCTTPVFGNAAFKRYCPQGAANNPCLLGTTGWKSISGQPYIVADGSNHKVVELRASPSNALPNGNADGIFFDFENNNQNYNWIANANHAGKTLTITYDCRYMSSSAPSKLDWILCDEFYTGDASTPRGSFFCTQTTTAQMPFFAESIPMTGDATNPNGWLVRDHRINAPHTTITRDYWQTVTQKIYIPGGKTFKKLWLRISGGVGGTEIVNAQIRNISISTCNTNAEISGSHQVCADKQTILTALGNDGVAPYTYEWSSNTASTDKHLAANAVAQGGNYTVTVTDATGCISTQSHTITKYQNPIASIADGLSPTPSYTIAPLCRDNIRLYARPTGAGYTYHWQADTDVDFNNQNPILLANANVVVKKEDTYRVTVTNAVGCTNATAMETFRIPPPVIQTVIRANIPALQSDIIDINELQCAGVFLYADEVWQSLSSTKPIVDNYKYSWSNGQEHIAGIWVTNSGIYTVTLTDPVTGCTNSASITYAAPSGTGCCLPYHEKIGADRSSITNLSSVINTFTHNDFVINGTLIIDQNWQLSQANIRMCEGATIIINPSKRFDISGTRIDGLDKMWNTIAVLPGAIFFAGGLVPLPQYGSTSFIEDAYRGVTLHEGGRLETYYMTFLNNYTGIYCMPSATGTQYKLNSALYTTFFQGDRNLKTAFEDQPEYSLRPRIGIHFNDNLIYADAVSGNWALYGGAFKGLNCGILSQNSNLRLRTVSFVDMQDYLADGSVNPNSINPRVGTGILADNSTIYLDGIVEFPDVSRAYFRNCRNGIFSNNSDITSTLSYFGDCTVGLGLYNNIAKTAVIKTGEFKNNYFGIHHYFPRESTLTVSNSNFTVTGNAVGVRIDEHDKQDEGNNNEVVSNLFEMNGGIAIQANNMGSLNSAFSHNQIRFSSTYDTEIGVQLNNCDYSHVQDNTIGNSVSANNPQRIAIDNNASTSSLLECNTLLNCDRGIVFSNTCGEGIVLKTNTLTGVRLGLDYGGTAALNNQENQGNKFINSGARNQAATSFSIPGQIITNKFNANGGLSEYWANPQIKGLSTVADWFYSDPSPQPSCAMLSAITTAPDIAYQERVALGLGDTPLFPDEIAWWSERNLYNYLKTNPSATIGKPILQNFVDSLDNTIAANFQALKATEITAKTAAQSLVQQIKAYAAQAENIGTQLAALQDSIAQDSSNSAQFLAQANTLKTLLVGIDAAQGQVEAQLKTQNDASASDLKAQNALLQPVLLQEVQQKIVNEVYYKSVAKGEIATLEEHRNAQFTAADYNILRMIAAQCPYTGGPAVFQARSILSSIDTLLYDDTDICAQQGINYRKAQNSPPREGLGEAFVYPNPADAYAVIALNSAIESGVVVVYDMMGRIVQRTLWQGGMKQALAVAELPNGLYRAEIMTTNNELIPIAKFIVAHP